MSTPCACGSIRDTLVGVAGRRVWRVAGTRQTSPPCSHGAALGAARGGREARPGAHHPVLSTPMCHGRGRHRAAPQAGVDP